MIDICYKHFWLIRPRIYSNWFSLRVYDICIEYREVGIRLDTFFPDIRNIQRFSYTIRCSLIRYPFPP